MLTVSTRGDTMENEDAGRNALLAHIAAMSSSLSVLEFMKAANKQLKGARAIMRDRKLDAETKSKTVRSYLAQWEAEQVRMIDQIEREIIKLHELQQLSSSIDPLTATRH